jgi:ABC-2 type transport system ATP-binding protein
VLLSSHVITDLDESCDHVIVLGEGRKLLDTPIVQAKAEHWLISGDSVGGAELVGSFVGGDGRRMNLVRGEPDPIGPRPREASLDEIVLGYLASARSAERAPN